MEDDIRLDLTLGLPCSGSSAISKGKKDDREKKLIEDFKIFLEGGNLIPEKTYFNTLSSGAVNVDGYKNPNGEGFWVANENKSSEVVQETRSNVGIKRKSSFDDIAHNANLHEKTHISISTDEESTDDTDDVDDSEAEVSTFRVGPQNGDISKRQNVGSDSTGVVKKFRRPYGAAPFFPNSMNMPYPLPRDSNPVASPGKSGYTPVQVPMADKDKSKGLVSNPQWLNPSFGRAPQNSDKTNEAQKISRAMQSEGTALERANDSGPTSQRGDSVTGVADGPNQPREEQPRSETPIIRPGIAGGVKFGGTGSHPNLPWVNTMGTGPNGRQISGVVYRYSATQLRIVCACHGSHLSPQEFIQHASEGEASPATGSGSGLASIQSSNSAGSAQS